MKQLEPRAVWLFFFGRLTSFFVFAIFIIFMTQPFVIMSENYSLIPVFSLLILLVAFAAAFVLAKLEFMFYKYDLVENGFQKEYGIIAKKYVTIPYERIQNIDISQSIIERILGLYDLNIQTAGLSSGMGRFGSRRAEGMLPGISKKDAEWLRDELIKRSREAGGEGSRKGV